LLYYSALGASVVDAGSTAPTNLHPLSLTEKAPSLIGTGFLDTNRNDRPEFRRDMVSVKGKMINLSELG